MDKTAIFTKVIVSIRYLKHFMMNIDKAHAQVTVFTFTNLSSNTNDEIRVVLIKHGVESLPSEASVS